MVQFDRHYIKELENYLYFSSIHDAILKNYNYDEDKNDLYIDVFNSIDNVKIHFIFYDVKFLLFIRGIEIGDNKEIIGLTVEKDYSYWNNFARICGDISNFLYLLFQMFSGDELHIVCKKILIDTEKVNSIFNQ